MDLKILGKVLEICQFQMKIICRTGMLVQQRLMLWYFQTAWIVFSSAMNSYSAPSSSSSGGGGGFSGGGAGGGGGGGW